MADPSRTTPGDAADAAREAPRARGEITVHCIGASFRTTPIELRERLACTAPAQTAALARFGCGHESRPAGVRELAILSTCHRLELYAAGGQGSADALVELIEEMTGVGREEIAPTLYTLSGAAAVRHLCRVACGLDSVALGEPQVLGQVADAFSLAVQHGAAGPVLSAAFRGAVRAGRRARAETGISRNPITISSVAVNAVGGIVSDLAAASVLVVGSGEMAELAAAALHYRGVRDIRVVSRTHENAAQLAARVGGSTLTFERLEDALGDADIVLTSTAAPHQIISAEMAAAAMARRPSRPLVIVDIAMPRDVDPAVAGVENVRLFHVDDLQRYVTLNFAERASEVPRAEAIAEAEAAECVAWMRQLEVAPLVADLRARTDEIRRRALQQAARHFAHLSDADRAKIEAFSESLVNKLLHDLTSRLKAEAMSGNAAEYALAIRHLFGLES